MNRRIITTAAALLPLSVAASVAACWRNPLPGASPAPSPTPEARLVRRDREDNQRSDPATPQRDDRFERLLRRDQSAGRQLHFNDRASGIQKATKTGYSLVADGRLTVDFALEAGEVTESVEVIASTGETVNSTSGEVARVIDRAQVQELALNGRNYLQLTTLIPARRC